MKKLEEIESVKKALKVAEKTVSWGVTPRMLEAVEKLGEDQFETGSSDGYNWATVAQVDEKGWIIEGSCGYGSRGSIVVDQGGYKIHLETCGNHSMDISGRGDALPDVTPDSEVSYQSWGDEPRNEYDEDEEILPLTKEERITIRTELYLFNWKNLN